MKLSYGACSKNCSFVKNNIGRKCQYWQSIYTSPLWLLTILTRTFQNDTFKSVIFKENLIDFLNDLGNFMQKLFLQI